MEGEVKRMIGSRSFLAALLLAMAAISLGTTYPQLDNLLSPGTFLGMVKGALLSRTVTFLLPVAAVLPWSDSFLGEWKGGFLKSSLPRVGKQSYLESKVFTVALSGFLTWILAGILTVIVFFIIFFPMEQQGEIALQSWQELAGPLLRTGLSGGIISTLGGICGAAFGSVYMAWGLPFVAWYFCIILQERYFKKALWVYPSEWISGATQWGNGQMGLWLFLILFLAAAMGIFAMVLYGKLEEL